MCIFHLKYNMSAAQMDYRAPPPSTTKCLWYFLKPWDVWHTKSSCNSKITHSCYIFSGSLTIPSICNILPSAETVVTHKLAIFSQISPKRLYYIIDMHYTSEESYCLQKQPYDYDFTQILLCPNILMTKCIPYVYPT